MVNNESEPIPQEQYSCEMYSKEFYLLCCLGGTLASGVSNTIVTPLDVIKCRMQVDPVKYNSLFRTVKLSVKEGGFGEIWKGWSARLVGFSIQGSIKYGGYEYLKHLFEHKLGEEHGYSYRTLLHLAASAASEFMGTITMAPFEAAKVRIQITPNYTTLIARAMPDMYRKEGMSVFFKGLVPIWGRQIPFSTVKLSSYERIIEKMYEMLPKSRSECSKIEQLLITFVGGYTAGILGAIASQPCDTITSQLYKEPGLTLGKVIHEMGFMGIWNGLGPRIVMIGTLSAFQLLIYDAFKVYTRIPRPPPAEIPPSLKLKNEQKD